MWKKEYLLLEAGTAVWLSAQINDYVNRGWEPIGNHAVTFYRDHGGDYPTDAKLFTQMMVHNVKVECNA